MKLSKTRIIKSTSTNSVKPPKLIKDKNEKKIIPKKERSQRDSSLSNSSKNKKIKGEVMVKKAENNTAKSKSPQPMKSYKTLKSSSGKFKISDA